MEPQTTQNQTLNNERLKDGGLSMPDFDIIDKSLKAG